MISETVIVTISIPWECHHFFAFRRAKLEGKDMDLAVERVQKRHDENMIQTLIVDDQDFKHLAASRNETLLGA